MANDFYSRYATFAAGTNARGSEVKAEFDLVVNGFNAVNSALDTLEAAISGLQVGDPPGFATSIDTRWYAADTSASTSAYTIDMGASGTEYVPDGYTIDFSANNNNVGACTLEVADTLTGALPIKKPSGDTLVDLEADDINSNTLQTLTKMGSNWILRTSAASGVPVGTMIAFGGSSLPDGYLLCYGQAISRVDYAELFSTIGTTYGSGNGSDTFNVPDLRGKTPMGIDNMGGSAADRELPYRVGSLTDPDGPVTVNWIIKV